MKTTEFNLIEPKQERSKKTFNKLLNAAQEILAEKGFEAINSNIIVERAGMTPPAFYRYFPNKIALLQVLCNRLMDTQNKIIRDRNEQVSIKDADDLIREVQILLKQTLQLTQDFLASHELLVLMRSHPDLREIRTNSHKQMSEFLADEIFQSLALPKYKLLALARLAIDLGYATVELVFEAEIQEEEFLLRKAAIAICSIFSEYYQE